MDFSTYIGVASPSDALNYGGSGIIFDTKPERVNPDLSHLTTFMGSDSSYDQPRTSDTYATDLLQQGQSIDDGSGSSWAGWFQGLGTALIGYSLARDANKQRAQQTYQGSTVPLARVGNGALAVNPVLLIGIGLIVVLAMKK